MYLGWLEHVDIVNGVAADACHHFKEQVVPLKLVLHQGVPLGVPSQPHSLLASALHVSDCIETALHSLQCYFTS